ncbi:hypothetical protein ABIE85_002109 [Bradyrhizobium diazoefficiens]|uniref:hypothetical protein n=1 Tax=Bradyrhizobium diazoefficiens TaxID=1355477 RepID=UPI00272B21E2|nr:hypothetical protein [Bradyrhizobium diazoefficiens]WLA60883.1 hypothetical protein QIH81_20115 [Bradyrhizobium diazoefficiens]
MQNSAVKASREPQESFAALAAAVHPAWHQAIIRLANASERVAFRLEAFMGTPIDGGMACHARELVKDLIDFLDQLEADPDLEPSFGSVAYGYPAALDECEPEDEEPSLGSPDRMTDQTRWGAGSKDDLELDDCDREDADPNETKQQAPEMCPCA